MRVMEPFSLFNLARAVAHESWYPIVSKVLTAPAAFGLEARLTAAVRQGRCLPAPERIFQTLADVAFEDVRVVILGQDPYPTPGHAIGRAFAVEEGLALPRSLTNIFKEVAQDTGQQVTDQTLGSWARQGVFLLNTSLTVSPGKPGSHRKWGWEKLTTAIVKALGERQDVIFLLWGQQAQKLKAHIASEWVLCTSHPSPLSARRGFAGSGHFSKTNQILEQLGQQPVVWGE